MACLEAGVPMVVLPLAGGDQAGNAQRCATLGVARVVGVEQRTPEAIREAVRAVLNDPLYRENAARLREEITCLPGLDRAVDLLTQLAAR
jgi:UDP:flavonoid glycosyltransferase YjiC (YdhE family)